MNNLANQVVIAKNWKTVNTGVEHDMLSSSDSIFGLCVCETLQSFHEFPVKFGIFSEPSVN